MQPLLETLIHQEQETVIGSVIWLHGLAASGDDFLPVAPMMKLPDVRFVFPHAPVRRITINGGMPGRAWYDITTLVESDIRETESHIFESAVAIEALIQAEVDRGIPSENIILMGFSQGAAMALHVAHRYSKPLLGAGVMSGYLLVKDRFEKESADANVDTPFFFSHGNRDPVVLRDKGHAAYTACSKVHPHTRWRDYPMAHEVCIEQLAEIRQWFDSLFQSRR